LVCFSAQRSGYFLEEVDLVNNLVADSSRANAPVTVSPSSDSCLPPGAQNADNRAMLRRPGAKEILWNSE